MKQLIDTTKLRNALKRFWNIHFVRRSYSDRLKLDLMIYGNCFEQSFKPNLLHKIFRPIFGLPINKKRIDPKKIRIGL
jgi:hypothetical protein